MKTIYQINESDYVFAYMLSRRLSRSSWFIRGFVVCVFIAAYVWLPLALKPIIVSIGVVGFGIWVVARLGSPHIARRYYRRHKAVREPYSIELFPESVVIASTRGRSRLRWNTIHSWREDQHNVIIFLSAKQFYIVPKRIAETGFSIDELLLRLRQF
ncbi:YcxB family protein [Vibrio sp. RC27]